MRKILIAFAACATVCVALPAAMSTSAEARTVIIKRGGDHHRGGWHRGHDRKVIVIKRGRGHSYRR